MHFRVPVPRPSVPGDLPRYPFGQMAVGDTLFAPKERAGVYSMKQTVRKRCQRNPGEAYRVVPAEGGGVIVERIA